jgi:hypothetical protein
MSTNSTASLLGIVNSTNTKIEQVSTAQHNFEIFGKVMIAIKIATMVWSLGYAVRKWF